MELHGASWVDSRETDRRRLRNNNNVGVATTKRNRPDSDDNRRA